MNTDIIKQLIENIIINELSNNDNDKDFINFNKELKQLLKKHGFKITSGWVVNRKTGNPHSLVGPQKL
jgi:dsRNA-specific ribonuclease